MIRAYFTACRCISPCSSIRPTKGARKNDKTKWIEKIRPLRKLLSEMRESRQISREDYGILYRRAKGGFFRRKAFNCSTLSI